METTSLFKPNKDIFFELLAGMNVGSIPFETSVELRTALAILHELVHLKQDIGTGLGAHDHLVSREAIPRLVIQSRFLLNKTSQPPYRAAAHRMLDLFEVDSGYARQVREDLEVLDKHTVGLRHLRSASWNYDANVRAVLRATISDDLTDEDLSLYSLRRMLECEAASETCIRVMTSGFSAGAAEIVGDELYDLWQPFMMSEEYHRVLIDVALAANGEITGEVLPRILLPIMRIASFLIDAASSYPPPSLLYEWDRPPQLYDPVVRYLIYLRSFRDMNAEATAEFVEAVLQQRRAAAESVLDLHSQVHYPKMAEIYGRWVDELEPLANAGDTDSPLFGIRLAMFKARLSQERLAPFEVIIESRAPVQVLAEGTGITGYMDARHALDDGRTPNALLRGNLDRGLMDLFYGTGTFRCPMARAAICDARQSFCATGIYDLNQLPPYSVCEVRKDLKDLGYWI